MIKKSKSHLNFLAELITVLSNCWQGFQNVSVLVDFLHYLWDTNFLDSTLQIIYITSFILHLSVAGSSPVGSISRDLNSQKFHY